MKSTNRYKEYESTELDVIILKMKNGQIKCGKYSNLVKIDKKKYDKNQKEFFN